MQQKFNPLNQNSFLKNSKGSKKGRKISYGRVIITLMVLGYLFLVWVNYNSSQQSEENITYSQMLNGIKENEVEKILVYNDHLIVDFKDESTARVEREANTNFVQTLSESGINPQDVNFEFDNEDLTQLLGSILATLGPIILTAILFLYIFKQAGKAQSSIFSFSKSKAKYFNKGKQSITFNDVAGLTEVKEELKEVVDFLKNPQKYRKLGARPPKGVLLVGPSGVGKTLLARAVAGQANVPFFSIAGSEFMEILVGVGASRVRDLFANAKKAAPSIIFIDEIDAIGRARGLGGFGGGHDERDQTLNQILVEMDGFEPTDRVVVMASTNRGDLLDQALLRPGRFDRRITLTFPDLEERAAIIKLHSKGKPFEENVSWDRIAQRTVGFSGADLENMLNEAAILTARKEKTKIGMEEIDEGALKVKLGPAKKRVFSEQDKRITAFHECGHAITSWKLENTDPVQKISIVSRGMALGFTLIPPEKDRPHVTKDFLVDQITALMGGRAAEELMFNQMTTGAANDIQNATKIARDMVIEYGMSSLGPLNLSPQIDAGEWSKNYMNPQEVSSETQSQIDKEVRRIINESYEKAKVILKKNKKSLVLLSEELIKQETLDFDVINKILKIDGKK